MTQLEAAQHASAPATASATVHPATSALSNDGGLRRLGRLNRGG